MPENELNLEPINEELLMAQNPEEILFKDPEIITDENTVDTTTKSDDVVDTTKKDLSSVTGDVDTSTAEINDEYWKEFKNILGDDYDYPEMLKKGVNDKGEPLTSSEKLSLLRNEMLSTTQFGASEEDDRIIRKWMQESANPNFDRNKFLQDLTTQQNIDSLPMNDFMFMHYKEQLGVSETNKEGFTDEEIQQFIDKKDPLELKENYLRLKKERNSIQEQRQIETKKAIEQEWTKNYEKAEEENKNTLKDYISKVTNMRNIDGFELGETDKKEFIKALPDMIKRNVKDVNGNKIATSPAEDLLLELTSSPEKSMMLLPILWMYSTGKLKNYTSQIREQAKRDVDNKLSNTRMNAGGNSDFQGSSEIDQNKLYQG